MTDDVLDLRDLADEWLDAIDSDGYVSNYVALCNDLGIAPTPEALRDYGESYDPTLIRDTYFTDYAQELAENIAPFASNSPEAEILSTWPYRCIDWEFAARELKYDYSEVRFNGDSYYIRSC